MYNLDKALLDEQYARDIIIDVDRYGNNIYFDDVIFILSCMIGSGIDIKIWKNVLSNNEGLFKELVFDAQIIHTYDWDEAVMDVVERCGLYNYIDLSRKFGSHKRSRSEAFVISKKILINLQHNSNAWEDPFNERLKVAL